MKIIEGSPIKKALPAFTRKAYIRIKVQVCRVGTAHQACGGRCPPYPFDFQLLAFSFELFLRLCIKGFLNSGADVQRISGIQESCSVLQALHGIFKNERVSLFLADLGNNVM